MMPLDATNDDGLRPVAEINVTPFIDVVLVLLIIFMVAAPLAMAEVPLKLPKSEAQPAQVPPEPAVLSLTVDGRIFIDDAEVPEGELPARIKALLASDPERVIMVRADTALPYGDVVARLGELGRLGASRLSLLSQQQEQK
jgi:biopolymer transport protein TolR